MHYTYGYIEYKDIILLVNIYIISNLIIEKYKSLLLLFLLYIF